jgi:hypothetical protein
MSDCDICTEKFNKSNRKPIVCYCGAKCCKTCLKIYILTLDDPECMSNECTVVFDKKFLSQNFDKKFINTEYKLHRETVLFNRELALLPATQLELEQVVKREQDVIKARSIKFKISILRSFINECTEIKNNIKKYNNIFPKQCPNKECNYVLTTCYCHGCETDITSVYKTFNLDYINKICSISGIYDLQSLYDLQNEKFIKINQTLEIENWFDLNLLDPMFILLVNNIKQTQYNTEIDKLDNSLNKLHFNNDSINVTNDFIRQCPNIDCNGFLTHELTCKLCNCVACNDCHEIVTYNHECNPETVKTLKLLASDTKLCPGCTVPIYKINGCDNMYCIKCKVSFRWTTLKIKATVDRHNPEYLADMYRITGGNIPRDPNDILCGRELDYNFKGRLINKCKFGKYAISRKGNFKYYENENYIRDIIEKMEYIKNQKIPSFVTTYSNNNNLRKA